MAYADQDMSGSRVVSIIIVGLIHVAIGYVLVTGLAISAVKQVVKRVTTVDIEKPKPTPTKKPPPPPPQKAPPPPPIVAPPPPININTAPPPIQTVTKIPPPAPPTLQVPPPAPPPPPSLARPATTDHAERWSARIQQNYPPRAIRMEIQGKVGVTVTVGTNGRVESCRVSSSSGQSILDRAACDGMERYARFHPALNAAGNPTTGSYSTTIVYRLN